MHKIVKLFHGSNVVPDVLEAGKFYHDFLGSWAYEAQFLEFEGSRNGANLMGGTFSLETLAPVDPNGDAPSARFLKRHGAHFINIAFWVEDIRGLAQHLLDNGVRVALPGGAQVKELPDEDFRFFVPHPKDAHGTLFEFIGEDPNFHDPRRRSWWDASYWSDRHPLGVEGLSHSTVVVADLDGASRFYEDLLGCTLVHEERYEEKGTLSRYYAIADSIIELAHPVDPSSDIAKHMAEHGPIVYAFTFKVRDLGSAKEHAERHGLTIRNRGGHTFELDPAQAFGGVFGFTDRVLPGHPALG